MSIYYSLLEDEYEGEKSEIGDIMDEVSRRLYKATKLRLGVCPVAEEIMSNNNQEVLLEEVIWKNMKDEEKVKKFTEYIAKIGGVKGDLLIIDPYLFCKNSKDDYKKLLQNILIQSQCRSLKIITDKSNYDESFFRETEKVINKSIQLIDTRDFHDRFWIANECKGFISGTSLNGVGKKYSSINIMDEEDVKDIIKIVNSI